MTAVDEATIRRLVQEYVELHPYDSAWPAMFAEEERSLRTILPPACIVRIEHFGSTAVPGLCAKPVIDVLVEVTDLTMIRERIAPVLAQKKYEYVWRPMMGNDTPPFYAWFIKRDDSGRRTHHIHMVDEHFPVMERIRFRDHLRSHPDDVAAYAALKERLQSDHPNDREAYTIGKTNYINDILKRTA